MKSLLMKLLPVELIERLRINMRDFNANSPILIYQVGKVGSSSVYKSLQRSKIKHPLYHIHTLTKAGVEAGEKWHRDTADPYLPHPLIVSKLLRDKIAKSPDTHPKIITLVRDPIACIVSGTFQDMEKHRPFLLHSNGEVNVDSCMQYLEKKLISDYSEVIEYVFGWFDRELKEFSGIDLYREKLDISEGYCIAKNERADVLLIRMEDMTKCFRSATAEFFNMREGIDLQNANLGSKKRHSRNYQEIKDSLKIPEAVCKRIYSDPRVDFFYHDLVPSLIAKWTG